MPFIKDKAYNIPATLGQFKRKFEKFIIKMQSDDEKYEWLETNFNIDKYLVKIEHDPYFLEAMHSTAISSVNVVLESQGINEHMYKNTIQF